MKTKGLEFQGKNAPKPYPATEQQLKMRRVAQECGIVKGINKAELMRKMKDCVGPKMRKQED
ncbi:MAG: hypothetical protein PHQ43_05490 [Dehalococcoidales bacterium]|nr:hypothetical protein [Dehalococcoidales bacterium]